MKIYTFYEPLGNPDDPKLLEFWRHHWAGMGYEPVVLGLADAKKHPLFHCYSKRIATYPTANQPYFEQLCFLRWLAVHHVMREPAVFADYDVFCQADTPMLFNDFPKMINGEQWGGPGFVAGTREQYGAVIALLATYDPCPEDKGHVSDMTIMVNTPTLCQCEDWWRCYGNLGWKEVPLVHFGNHYMATNEPRSEQVRRILKR